MIKFNPNSSHSVIIKYFDKEYDYDQFKIKVYNNGWLYLNSRLLDSTEISFQIELRTLLSKYFNSFSRSVNVLKDFQIGLDNDWINPEEKISLKICSGTLEFKYKNQVILIDLSKLIISSSVFNTMIQSQFNHYIPITSETTPNFLGELGLRFFDDEKTYRFDVDDDRLLHQVDDELDRVLEATSGGMRDLSAIPQAGLNKLAKTCEQLVKREPAFLDGYAHWVGALIELDKHKKALEIGLPALNAAFEILNTAPRKSKRYKLNYYELPNRPFFRLAHNIVLAFYGVNKNDEAKELAQKMLKLWPSDNSGFRFLLTPLDEEI